MTGPGLLDTPVSPDIHCLEDTMSLLNENQIEASLASLNGWVRNGQEIRKTYRFPGFLDAIAFVNRVADLAEEADHHPDIDVRFDRVTLTLSTHSAGGLTAKDFSLAGTSDRMAAEAS